MDGMDGVHMTDAAATPTYGGAAPGAAAAGCPRIVVVPPPTQRLWMIYFLIIPLWLALVSTAGRVPLLLAALVCGLIVYTRWELPRRRARAWRAWTAQHGEPDLCARDLAQDWLTYSLPPALDAIRAWARRHAAALGTADRAVVIVFGTPKLPAAGEYRFEPVVIEPRTLTGIAVAIGTIALGQAVLLALVVLRMRSGIWSSQAARPACVVMLCAGVFAALWLWRQHIRPGYLRLAPRLAQIVQFTLGRAAPTIREYPVSAGRLFVVHMHEKGATITLAQEDRHDRLVLTRRDAARYLDDLWRALLSTAPTPPLPDDALVG
jgi:hypothetical protein